MLETLIEDFQYDLWANLRWLEYLQARAMPEVDHRILQHILGAAEIWWTRLGGVSLTEIPKPELTREILERSSERWIQALRTNDSNPVIEYRNTQGQAFQQTAFRIARHVIDHGVYHRGELRGLCRARQEDDFPETALALYFMERGLTK